MEPSTGRGIGNLIGALLNRSLAAYGAGVQEDALRRYLEQANMQVGTPTASQFGWSTGQDLNQAAAVVTPQAAQPTFPIPSKSDFLQRFLAPSASTQGLWFEAQNAAQQLKLAQALQLERQRINAQQGAELQRMLAFQKAKAALPLTELEQAKLNNLKSQGSYLDIARQMVMGVPPGQQPQPTLGNALAAPGGQTAPPPAGVPPQFTQEIPIEPAPPGMTATTPGVIGTVSPTGTIGGALARPQPPAAKFRLSGLGPNGPTFTSGMTDVEKANYLDQLARARAAENANRPMPGSDLTPKQAGLYDSAIREWNTNQKPLTEIVNAASDINNIDLNNRAATQLLPVEVMKSLALGAKGLRITQAEINMAQGFGSGSDKAQALWRKWFQDGVQLSPGQEQDLRAFIYIMGQRAVRRLQNDRADVLMHLKRFGMTPSPTDFSIPSLGSPAAPPAPPLESERRQQIIEELRRRGVIP